LYFYSIISIGLYINLSHSKKHWEVKVFLFFIITILATLTRPFYGMLIILPCYYLIKYSNRIVSSVAMSLSAFLLCGLGYYLIYKYYSAPYFHALLGDDLSSSIVSILAFKFTTAFSLVKSCFSRQSFYGAVFVCYILISVMYLSLVVYKKAKRESDYYTYLFFLTYTIIMLLSAFVMIENGAEYKHLCELIVIGILIVHYYCDKWLPKIILALSLLILMFWFNPLTPQFSDPQALETIEIASVELVKNMPLSQTSNPYENTIIWVAYDSGNVWYQGLYAIPKGYGINMCTQEYVIDNFDSLKSKYIYTRTDGTIGRKCIESGKRIIYQYWGMSIFEL